MTPSRDRGSISAFVVVTTLAVMMCAGLVIDGARNIAAHVQVADHAENAARAGAQELISLRDGAPQLDADRARAAALAYLGAHGLTGAVHVTRELVTVSVDMSTSTVLLQLVGVSTMHASATRSADAVTT